MYRGRRLPARGSIRQGRRTPRRGDPEGNQSKRKLRQRYLGPLRNSGSDPFDSEDLFLMVRFIPLPHHFLNRIGTASNRVWRECLFRPAGDQLVQLDRSRSRTCTIVASLLPALRAPLFCSESRRLQRGFFALHPAGGCFFLTHPAGGCFLLVHPAGGFGRLSAEHGTEYFFNKKGDRR